MNSDDFRQSLAATEPPAGFTHALAGLWWDAKGDWKRAHESAQQDEGKEGSWVHAYLRRKEGDQGQHSVPVQPGEAPGIGTPPRGVTVTFDSLYRPCLAV